MLLLLLLSNGIRGDHFSEVTFKGDRLNYTLFSPKSFTPHPPGRVPYGNRSSGLNFQLPKATTNYLKNSFAFTGF